MKCVKMKKDSTILRVKDDVAHHLVTVLKEAVYVPKSEWKSLRNNQGTK
jgi:hypothetical protein